MKATVNGLEQDLPEGATLAALLERMHLHVTSVAVARNDEVVRRALLAHETIVEGDRIEIIKAVAGG